MRYKQFLFPEETKNKQWLKLTWKWTKIILGTFLIVSTIWGCGQMMGDANVASGKISSLYDFKNHNIAAVFFELLIGNNNVSKHHIFHLNGNTIYEYSFNGINSWGQAWSVTKSPFYGLFVYPIAWILVSLAKGFGGGGVGIIFAIFFTTLFIKLITLVFTFKAQRNQERMQAVQLKTAEVQAKYKQSRDPYAKQKMQMELMAIYKKEGINPISSFIPMFLSIPFLTAMFTVMRSTNLLKTAQIGLIKLIETPWSMINQGHWIYLVIVIVYLPIQLTSMLLPMFLNRSRQKVKTKESKKALKKQFIMQTIFIVVFTFFVFGTPAGVGIYWIISGGLQILQTVAFHYYNKHQWYNSKRKGTIKTSFVAKIKNKFPKRNQEYKPKKAKISLKY